MRPCTLRSFHARVTARVTRGLPALVCGGVLAGSLVAGCDNQDSGNGGPLDSTPMPVDLSSFAGAWFIHETGVTNFCPAEGACRQQLQTVIDELYSITEADSHCVLIDSLHHLILVEPYMSEADCSGAASADAATVDCLHEGIVAGDSLVTEVSGDILPMGGTGGWQANFTLAVQRPGEDDCGCMALIGIEGVPRPAGACEP